MGEGVGVAGVVVRGAGKHTHLGTTAWVLGGWEWREDVLEKASHVSHGGWVSGVWVCGQLAKKHHCLEKIVRHIWVRGEG